MAEENGSLFKERMFAIVIGLLMVGSAAGYAFMSVVPQGPNIPQIDTIVNRELTVNEQIIVLRTGRVLIENFYAENCTYCMERNSVLEKFAKRLDGFVVLENVLGNETKLDMIGVNGKIIPINNESISDEELFDTFCSIALKQPKECLLREV